MWVGTDLRQHVFTSTTPPRLRSVGKAYGPVSGPSRKSVVMKGSSSTSSSINNMIRIPQSLIREKVRSIYRVEQNPLPGLLGKGRGSDGPCGTHYHEGIAVVTESWKEVVIDRVSVRTDWSGSLRVQPFDCRDWVIGSAIRPCFAGKRVVDLWEAGGPSRQYVLAGPESNNCRDTVDRIWMYATGQTLERDAGRAALARSSIRKIELDTLGKGIKSLWTSRLIAYSAGVLFYTQSIYDDVQKLFDFADSVSDGMPEVERKLDHLNHLLSKCKRRPQDGKVMQDIEDLIDQILAQLSHLLRAWEHTIEGAETVKDNASKGIMFSVALAVAALLIPGGAAPRPPCR